MIEYAFANFLIAAAFAFIAVSVGVLVMAFTYAKELKIYEIEAIESAGKHHDEEHKRD